MSRDEFLLSNGMYWKHQDERYYVSETLQEVFLLRWNPGTNYYEGRTVMGSYPVSMPVSDLDTFNIHEVEEDEASLFMLAHASDDDRKVCEIENLAKQLTDCAEREDYQPMARKALTIHGDKFRLPDSLRRAIIDKHYPLPVRIKVRHWVESQKGKP